MTCGIIAAMHNIPTREIHVDGHKLVALELNGQATGTPIILLHGVTLSVNFWLTDAIFPHYGPCYALSLPGHYPATLPPGFDETKLTPEAGHMLFAENPAQYHEILTDWLSVSKTHP